MSEFSAHIFAWVALIILLAWASIRYGKHTFPSIFLAGVIFYLLVIPLTTGSNDAITGASGVATSSYYFAIVCYSIFFLFGVRLTSERSFSFNFLSGKNTASSYSLNKKVKFFYFLLLTIALILCAYSLSSRNIFQKGGEFLFTIIGFDLLLVVYFATRLGRSTSVNVLYFALLVTLYFYAGFRYRIVLLVLTELLIYLARKGPVFIKIVWISGGSILFLVLAAYGQVRQYGSLDPLGAMLALNFSPASLIAASGEQTMFFATVNVIESIDKLKLAGLEPFEVLITHFIPSALYPDKPRAEYIGAYLHVTSGLMGTGAAMHDVAQAILMFGFLGLPVASFLLGSLSGLLLNIGLRLSPNVYYSILLIVLFALIIPTRGYLAQQVTWGLSFVLPLIIIHKLTNTRTHRK